MRTDARTIGEQTAARAIRAGLTFLATRLLHPGLVAALAFGLVAIGHAQSQGVGQNGTTGGAGSQGGVGAIGGSHGFGHPGAGPFSNGDDDVDPVMAERRMRALNTERQKQMVSDTNKLLKLAKELNEEVATTNSASFTPDQLRKIGEIEKLARNVRERMAAAAGEAPSLLPPPTVIYPVH
jgi:hypothetical protein